MNRIVFIFFLLTLSTFSCNQEEPFPNNEIPGTYYGTVSKDFGENDSDCTGFLLDNEIVLVICEVVNIGKDEYQISFEFDTLALKRTFSNPTAPNCDQAQYKNDTIVVNYEWPDMTFKAGKKIKGKYIKKKYRGKALDLINTGPFNCHKKASFASNPNRKYCGEITGLGIGSLALYFYLSSSNSQAPFYGISVNKGAWPPIPFYSPIFFQENNP